MSIQEVLLGNTRTNRAHRSFARYSYELYGHIGRRITKRRDELGYTQEEVARMLGIKLEQQRKYESPLNELTATSLYHMARVLSVSVDYFYEGWGQSLSQDASLSSKPSHSIRPTLNSVGGPEVTEFLECYANITRPKVKKILRTLIEGGEASPQP